MATGNSSFESTFLWMGRIAGVLAIDTYNCSARIRETLDKYARAVPGQTEVAVVVALTIDQKLKIRAAANDWISRHLPNDRTHIVQTTPEYNRDDSAWVVNLATKSNGRVDVIGSLLIDEDACVLKSQDPATIAARAPGAPP